MYVSTQITGVGDTEDGLLDAGDAGKLKIIPNIFADIKLFRFYIRSLCYEFDKFFASMNLHGCSA